jgi:regulator of sirC expression with transglutaminase-like and TPR domain
LLGEACQAQQDVLGAVCFFSACVLLDPDNYIHLKQRADALLHLQDFQRALDDTERVVAAKPTWAKVGPAVSVSASLGC